MKFPVISQFHRGDQIGVTPDRHGVTPEKKRSLRLTMCHSSDTPKQVFDATESGTEWVHNTWKTLELL